MSTSPQLGQQMAPQRPSTLHNAAAAARRITLGRSHLIIVFASLLAFAGSYLAAFLLRFEFTFDGYASFFVGTMPFVVGLKLCAFYALGIYRIVWAYVGLRDLYRILFAAIVASALIGASNLLLLQSVLIPRSVLALDCLLTFITSGGLFALLRSAKEAAGLSAANAEPVIIVGAGDAGEALLREFQRNSRAGVRAVAFLDDDAAKHGRALRGVPILGSTAMASAVAQRFGVRRAFLAAPSAAGSEIRRITQTLSDAGMTVKVLPPMPRLSRGSDTISHLRDVSIEDLLRRPRIDLDDSAIAASLRGRSALVTGAAGSIGSELCRQILSYGPRTMVCMDIAETPMYELLCELQKVDTATQLHFELGDVTDAQRVDEIFRTHRPDVVFHAAALKHVPLCEAHPREAVRVNIGGTKCVADRARAAGCQTFVLISTDKAVNPSSIMGATKRIAEVLLGQLQPDDGKTRFVAVRFGNVLGSNGSVVPLFKRQIEAGGPITVTHPEMQRYFMLIPEAVGLVLQASVLGTGRDVFLLEMGEPVKIVDLALDLIRLSGFTPNKDIEIKFTGLRPGEKLAEELTFSDEAVLATVHPMVMRLKEDRSQVMLSRPSTMGIHETLLERLTPYLADVASLNT